jgi:hypothetical protein
VDLRRQQRRLRRTGEFTRLIQTTTARCATATAAAVLLLTSCSGSSQKHITIDSVRAVDSSEAALSPDAKLDRSLSLPGMRGVLSGTVGSTTAVKTLNGGMVVSLTDLLITGRFGFTAQDTAAYLPGQHAQLAVPGGRSSGATITVEDARVCPRFS